MEGITRENQIQILTQTLFFMQIPGQVMLDSLRSRSSTTTSLGSELTTLEEVVTLPLL